MNVKLHEKDVVERRREGRALYIDEFDYPRPVFRKTYAASAKAPSFPALTVAQINTIHRINEDAQRLVQSRLKSERIAVVKLDDWGRPDTDEDWYLPTLSQAIERWNFRDWELLFMDEVFGGVLVRGDRLLISEMHLKRIGISEITKQ
ncbi:MAG: hypothetical protein KIT48_20125 [Pseudolabrys sp.]|nr:hypothetical protein [Pseudolabrys sp.]